MSQLLADHTPQVTPVAAAKQPKAHLLTSADCIRTLEEKEAKKKQEAEERNKNVKKEKRRSKEKKKQKEKLKRR